MSHLMPLMLGPAPGLIITRAVDDLSSYLSRLFGIKPLPVRPPGHAWSSVPSTTRTCAGHVNISRPCRHRVTSCDESSRKHSY